MDCAVVGVAFYMVRIGGVRQKMAIATQIVPMERIMSENVFQHLKTLEAQGLEQIEAVNTLEELTQLNKQLLGKKGDIQATMKAIKTLPKAEKPKLGAAVNQAKQTLQAAFDAKNARLQALREQQAIAEHRVDLSLPGRSHRRGGEHILRTVQREIEDVFVKMGFRIALGPQIEDDFYNFEALNFPADHPARDMQDTLLVEDGSVLRTHTSPVQIRTMLSYPPPIRIIAPGAVYRRDDDVTHSPLFHQVEGLHVDRNLSLAHLKGILQHFAHELFSPSTPIRLRPSFFPFTEPSVEVDIGCIFCDNSGCRLCKQTGWIEILGAGMVDPNVFRECGIDPEVWSGWAFGIGIERVAMLKHRISDIRLFFESDLRFLGQFGLG